nr:hypothetical protein [Tanacetum cinerariifolium]
KTDLEEQSLDDLFNSLKIYEAEVKSSSSASTSTQNFAFVSSSNTDSTNKPVSAATSVSAMRIEQYFLMTDYSLWEVILDGDSPAPTRIVDGVLQPVAPTTAEHRLARKNELKVCGTLLMALPDKHQLKFNTHKDANT